MVNFTNPGVLGDAAYFRRYFEVSLYVSTFMLDSLDSLSTS